MTYKKVFSKYLVNWSEYLARLSFYVYKKVRISLSGRFPLKEHEKYRFEDYRFRDDSSTDMPRGFDYITQSDEDGRIELEYIDFYDYLPKESLDAFKKSLRKFVLKNKKSRFGPFRTIKDEDMIENMGRYVDRLAFFNLDVVVLNHNEFLERHVSQVAISLRNLSPSFLIVKYRFYISDSFNEKISEVCAKKYAPYTEVCRQVGVPWYKPQKFGRSIYTGDDARKKEYYSLISELKWMAFSELRRYFTIYFEQHQLFPPTFDTYKTNIRPSNTQDHLKFWDSVMLGRNPDYAPAYNACVSWDHKNGKHEGMTLSAYCGGNYSKSEHLPDIAKHEISDIFAVYLVASTFRRIAERDIAACNKKISKAICRAKASLILKTRVYVERQLYYSYRFICEFTGDTIDHDEAKEFKSSLYKDGSFTSNCLKGISKSTSETKKQIDTLVHILDDAAEYGSAKANWSLQLFMMIVTVLSLIVAIIALADFKYTTLITLIETMIDHLNALR